MFITDPDFRQDDCRVRMTVGLVRLVDEQREALVLGEARHDVRHFPVLFLEPAAHEGDG